MLNFLPSQAIELKSLDELDIPTLTEICQFVANSYEFQPDEKVITTKDTTFTTVHSSYRHPKGSEGKIVKYQLAANLYSVAFSNQKLRKKPMDGIQLRAQHSDVLLRAKMNPSLPVLRTASLSYRSDGQ